MLLMTEYFQQSNSSRIRFLVSEVIQKRGKMNKIQGYESSLKAKSAYRQIKHLFYQNKILIKLSLYMLVYCHILA